ncbi:MAG: S8 family serine peptidase, partial [Verrucomicrobiaceae bacterium]
QWDLHNTGQNGGTPGADIHAPEAWSVSTGSASVIVAVIDTGMDLTHPDLVANLWTNPNETGGGNDSDGLDNDHNGYIDDEHGWNFYDKNANPLDDNGHGSHTSGTVGAVGNNGKGISGVNQTVRIMPLKFLNANGSGTNSDAIEAINYATANQAFVTSNSWGGSGYSQGMFDAISTANAAGVGFIAAAGNSGISNDKYPDYPASFNVDNIISVAATDNTDTLAWFSNFGQATVHLAAPGVNTYSTYKNGGYTAMSGTSMATPHVSGAAALLKAANSALSFAQIKAMLVSQCDPQPSLAGKVASGGRLNVARSLVPATGPLLQANVLTVDDNPVNGATGNADHIASPGETVKIIIQVANIGAFDATNVQGALTVKNNDTGITLAQANTSYGTITAGTSVNNAAPAFVISIAANKTPSDVILTLVLSDSSGNSWTQDLTLKVRTVATLSGVVTALTGGAPLAGATILITGPEKHTITTQADGSYSVVLTNGGYSVRASATGFIAETKTINVPPSVTNLDFILGYSQAQITPLTLSSTQNEGETKSQTITIANNGDKAMTYKIVQVPPKLPGNTGALSINPPPVSRNLSPSDMEISPPHKLSFSRLADASTSSQSPLPFADGFEDGMWGRWFPSLADSSVREVVGNTAGTGAKSFHFHYAGPEDAHLTGIEQDFDWGSKPGYVNFWTRPGPEDQATAYTVLGDVSFVLDETGFHIYLVDFIWFFANANGRFYLNDNVGGNQSVVYTEN